MQRLTNQKKILQEEVKKITEIFDAPELLSRVKKKNPGMGLATIYRFLKELENKGEIHSYYCDKRKIYSHNEKNHVHFICESCGAKIHVKLDKIDLPKNIPGKVCHFQLDIMGVCEECLRSLR